MDIEKKYWFKISDTTKTKIEAYINADNVNTISKIEDTIIFKMNNKREVIIPSRYNIDIVSFNDLDDNFFKKK